MAGKPTDVPWLKSPGQVLLPGMALVALWTNSGLWEESQWDEHHARKELWPFSEGRIERIWCKSKGIKEVDGAERLGISWGLVLAGEMTDFGPKMWLCSQG